jgi:translation initiation factor IF-2
VPIIVAINKIDKPDADPQRVRTGCSSTRSSLKAMGGEVLDVEVSALKGTNLDKLIETILLQAEVLELKANPSRPALRHRHRGEARSRPRSGRDRAGPARHAASGDILVAGSEWGRVRALIDDRGEQVKRPARRCRSRCWA